MIPGLLSPKLVFCSITTSYISSCTPKKIREQSNMIKIMRKEKFVEREMIHMGGNHPLQAAVRMAEGFLTLGWQSPP